MLQCWFFKLHSSSDLCRLYPDHPERFTESPQYQSDCTPFIKSIQSYSRTHVFLTSFYLQPQHPNHPWAHTTTHPFQCHCILCNSSPSYSQMLDLPHSHMLWTWLHHLQMQQFWCCFIFTMKNVAWHRKPWIQDEWIQEHDFENDNEEDDNRSPAHPNILLLMMIMKMTDHLQTSTCSSQRHSHRWILGGGRGFWTTVSGRSSLACHQSARNDKSWGRWQTQLSRNKKIHILLDLQLPTKKVARIFTTKMCACMWIWHCQEFLSAFSTSNWTQVIRQG